MPLMTTGRLIEFVPQNEVVIPERAVVKFRAGKELKEEVEKLNPAKFRN